MNPPDKLFTRRDVLATFVAAAASGTIHAQDSWPSKPIKLLIIAAPGGLPDVTARILAQHLGKSLGQPVVVENRAGGGGNIATAAVGGGPPPAPPQEE